MEHGNLFGGRLEASLGAGRRELRGVLAPWPVIGSAPVSDRRDVEAALAHLRAVPVEPAVLERAAVLLERSPDLAAELERAVGLSGEEARLFTSGFAAVCERARRVAGRSSSGEGGIAWCAPDWSALALGTFELVARELASGRAVLLFADERVAGVVARVATALVEAGLPSESFALLHGARADAYPAAGAAPGLAAVVGSGAAEHVLALRRSVEGRRCEERLSRARSGALEVGEDEDLARVADEIVDAAFGRVRTLSGQLDGQLGRVWCAERAFSELTERLLEALERSSDVARPLPQVDEEAVERVRRAWALGLDEGATPVRGGRVPDGRRRDERVVEPIVFTNVEARMRSARAVDPVPLLRLLRLRRGRAPAGRGAAPSV